MEEKMSCYAVERKAGEQSTWGEIEASRQRIATTITEYAAQAFRFLRALPSHVPHAFFSSKTWILQNWSVIWPAVSGFFGTIGAVANITSIVKFVMANPVIKKVVQKIKEALIATWEYLKRLSLKQKIFYGTLAAISLWAGILPWTFKAAIGFSVSIATSAACSIVGLIALPLTLVGLTYLAYRQDWFYSSGSQQGGWAYESEGREMVDMRHYNPE